MLQKSAKGASTEPSTAGTKSVHRASSTIKGKQVKPNTRISERLQKKTCQTTKFKALNPRPCSEPFPKKSIPPNKKPDRCCCSAPRSIPMARPREHRWCRAPWPRRCKLYPGRLTRTTIEIAALIPSQASPSKSNQKDRDCQCKAQGLEYVGTQEFPLQDICKKRVK